MTLEPIAPPITEVDLAALEARIGVRLPDDYRRFLLEHNGGEPTPRCFRFADRTGPHTDGAVRAFAGIGSGDSYDWDRLYRTFAAAGRVPPDVVPIAKDSFGNLVCIVVRGAHRGTVYFWDHELETDPASYENMDRVADSFTAFLACLHVHPSELQS